MARWEIMLADGDRTLVEAHHWVDSRGIWLDGQDEHGEAVAHIPIARISWVKLDAAGGAQPGAQVAGDPALSISPAEVSSAKGEPPLSVQEIHEHLGYRGFEVLPWTGDTVQAQHVRDTRRIIISAAGLDCGFTRAQLDRFIDAWEKA